MRRRISSKSQSCPEGLHVDAAGISGKVSASYRGRSAGLLGATVAARRREGSAEVSRGHSRFRDRTEGPNRKQRNGDSNFDAQRRRAQKGCDARVPPGGEPTESASGRDGCVKRAPMCGKDGGGNPASYPIVLIFLSPSG